jgi:hypothetical protein
MYAGSFGCEKPSNVKGGIVNDAVIGNLGFTEQILEASSDE